MDGDGYGDGTSPINPCEVQAGLVSNTEDCNDDPDNNGAEQYPGRPEVCDNETTIAMVKAMKMSGLYFTQMQMETALVMPIYLHWVVKAKRVW